MTVPILKTGNQRHKEGWTILPKTIGQADCTRPAPIAGMYLSVRCILSATRLLGAGLTESRAHHRPVAGGGRGLAGEPAFITWM